MNLITDIAAAKFVSEIEKIHAEGLLLQSPPNKMLREIRVQFEEVFREITKNELPVETTFFDRMIHAEKKYGFDRKLQEHAHKARKICNGPAHTLRTRTQDDYKYCVEAFCMCIEFVSTFKCPDSIKSIFDAAITFDWGTVTVQPIRKQPAKPSKPQLTIREEDLFDNPTPRLAIALLLDTSGSMLTDDRISKLNEGVKCFFEDLIEDETTRYSVELSILTFGQDVKLELDFANLERQVETFKKSMPLKVASSQALTPMGRAVTDALDILTKRKAEYSKSGVDYYQPWLVLMTDGQPTDNIDNAVKKVVDLVNKKKLSVFPIGIGSGANLSILNQFSPNRPALELNGLKFREFFEWLKDSAYVTSQSNPGDDNIALPPIVGWTIL